MPISPMGEIAYQPAPPTGGIRFRQPASVQSLLAGGYPAEFWVCHHGGRDPQAALNSSCVPRAPRCATVAQGDAVLGTAPALARAYGTHSRPASQPLTARLLRVRALCRRLACLKVAVGAEAGTGPAGLLPNGMPPRLLYQTFHQRTPVSQVSRPEFLDVPGWGPLAEPVANKAIAPRCWPM